MAATKTIKNPAAKQLITELRISDLDLEGFQRSGKFQRRRVDEMHAEGYRVELDMPIIVAPLPNGKYSIIDGGTRATFKSELGHRTCTAVVTKLPSYKERASLFVDIQDKRANLTPLQEFKGRVEAAEEEATEIVAIATECGFNISGINNSMGPTMKAVNTLRTIHKKYGPEVLRNTLDVISAAWNTEKEALKNYYLIGVAYFIHRYKDRFDIGRLKARLQTVTPLALKTNAEAMSNFSSPESRAIGMSRAIVNVYNYRLSSEKKLSFD